MNSPSLNIESSDSNAPSSVAEANLATVTVIVPIRNEEQHIGSTLDQLLSQQREGIQAEILVVDGRSTDRTREIVNQYVQQHPEIQLLDNPKHLSSAARNVAIKHSTSEILVVIDGHCEIPSTTYFLDLVEAFERTGADCLGRPQPLDVSNATTLQQAIAAARDSRLGHHPDSYIYSDKEVGCPAASVAVAYRRSVFDHIGLFDERFDACEDYELNHRIDQAGMACYLVPKLAVNYHPRKSLQGLFRQLMRYGQGRIRLLRKHADSFSPMSLLPAAFLLGLIVGPLLSQVFPLLWYVYFSVIALYASIVGLFSIMEFKRHNLSTVLRLPFVFATIHLASGWGVLRECFTISSVRNAE